MIRYAFKEWAVICQALAEGRQAIILRKGGIAEERGVFQPEHQRFWLYPTYVHQQRDGIKTEAIPYFESVERNRPQPGTLRLEYYALVGGVFWIQNLDDVLSLDHLHIWSEETVRKRFAYRSPGLFVLPVRILRAANVHELHEHESYEGCKTWVELDQELPDDGKPVMGDREYKVVFEELARRFFKSAL